MVGINSKYYCFGAYKRLNEKAYNYYSCFLKFFISLELTLNFKSIET